MTGRAVVLLSGGLDSCVAAAWAAEEGLDLHALTLRYGQRHEREIQAARDVADALDVVEHRVLDVPLDAFGGSALTDAIDVPTDRDVDADDIPVTYVPARNTVFLALAASWAETLEADAIVIGANARDYSGYPDCRPKYYASLEETLRLGTKRGVEGAPVTVETPLLELSKAGIVELGAKLDAPLGATWSCYQGGEEPCGDCDACKLRARGFEEAGVEDPALA